MPLCKELYSMLESKFGKIKVSNEGHSLQARTRKIGYEVKTEILYPGEYYCVNCPFCNDRRQRLWINHRFAEYRWLAVCYNETRCMDGPFGKENRKELYRLVFHTDSPIILPVLQGVETDPSKPLSEISLPGDVLFFDELPEDHISRLYLNSRGYDPMELQRFYGMGYCTKVFDNAHYPLVSRIFIPVIMNGMLVGWQGRFVGDPDWKVSRVQKYFNLRGMSKKDMLYNFDVAKSKDMVVLVEGAADVWRVGPKAVALMGSDMADQQCHLIRQTWAGKPIAVFMDADAAHKSAEIASKLFPFVGNKVFPVIPEGKDPGSLTTEECWSAINSEMNRRSLTV